jgi:hypothetical protein
MVPDYALSEIDLIGLFRARGRVREGAAAGNDTFVHQQHKPEEKFAYQNRLRPDQNT